MNYAELKRRTNRGWNTWNVRSVLTFSHLPEGFTINLCLKDIHNPNMLRESLIGRTDPSQERIIPGPRSYDGRCTRMSMTYYETELDIKTVVEDDQQIILLTPLKLGSGSKPTLSVEVCQLWGKEGSIFKKNGCLGGEYDSRRFDIYLDTQCPVIESVQTYASSPSVSLCLDGPVVISTRPCTVEEAEALYEKAFAELEAANNTFGAHAEAYAAMKTCLAWDTIYEMEHDRICSPVSRLWCLWNRGYVLFDWDTYFAALMASLENKDLAMLNAIAITDEVTDDGFVPNYGTGDNVKSFDRSQPPVGAHVCLEIYKKYPERWFIEHVYPILLSWNRWFVDHRMTEEGYLCWGSEPDRGQGHDWQAAAYESGLDNSPMFDGIPFDPERHIMLLADVGLMGLYVMDCRCLAELAKIIGREDVLDELETRKAQVEAALATLWDEDFGLFLNKDLRDGSLSRRISPTNFYALNADFITEDQKRRMMEEHFYNPNEFWGEFIMPTIARNDPAYPDQNYWRGRIWAPTNFLAYASMKYAGLKQACNDLAAKSEALLLKEWRLHGHVHENYCGDSGMGCNVGNSDAFYHWGGLLAYIAIDNENSD
jgi:hypothetical protein